MSGCSLPPKRIASALLRQQVAHAHSQRNSRARAAQVDLVLLPSTTGDFGVMPGHVPTVAQLRPGVITVHKEMDKVSSAVASFADRRLCTLQPQYPVSASGPGLPPPLDSARLRQGLEPRS